MSDTINEGITFGQREISEILSRSEDFNIGIEYEFRPTNEQELDFLDYLKDKGLDGAIENLVPEHDNMLELITKKLPLSTALKHIKGMFQVFKEQEIEVPSMAGLHISISTNRYNLDDFNISKFFVIMNSAYIHNIFPERKHVTDKSEIIKSSLSKLSFASLTKDTIKEIEAVIESNLSNKYQTINISEYGIRNGRIELRFFGGENYHEQYEQIKVSLLRSLLLLEVGYSDLFQKQYYKELGSKYLPHSNEDLSAYKKYYSNDDMKELKLAVSRKNPIDILKVIVRPYNDTQFRGYNLKEAFDSLQTTLRAKIVQIVSTSPQASYLFARRVLQGQFKEGEKAISKEPRLAVQYAELIQERFKVAEDIILSSSEYAPQYIFTLNASNLISNSGLTDLLVKLPSDVLEEFYRQSTSITNQRALSFMELEAALIHSGDHELIEPLMDVYLDSDSPEMKFNAVSLANEYHYKYSGERPLISRERLIELIDDNTVQNVHVFKYSTLLKEILRSLTLSDDDVLKYLPRLKKALVDDGVWRTAEDDDTYNTMAMSKQALDIAFAPRGEKVKNMVNKLFET